MPVSFYLAIARYDSCIKPVRKTAGVLMRTFPLNAPVKR